MGAPVPGLASIDPKKRGRLLRSAASFVKHAVHRYEGVRRLRIDVAGVHFGPNGPEVHYAEGAISAEEHSQRGR